MKTRTEIVPLVQANTTWRDYFQLCKPRVVLLMILTALVGMCLASPSIVPWRILLLGNLGIALTASSAAALNELLEHHLDKLMHRTNRRPIVQGKISRRNAIIFSSILCVLSMIILVSFISLFMALLTFSALIGYVGIYTLYLKHITPQNIVIGGLAGAAPPLLGWVAVTGHINPHGLILLLIIFTWTPPHFWALAIHRIDDYARANIPMLPNIRGIPYTKLNILFYTLLLSVISSLPFIIRMSGWIYFFCACLLNLGFIYLATYLFVSSNSKIPMRVFRYSILYLMLLFSAMLGDHYLNLLIIN